MTIPDTQTAKPTQNGPLSGVKVIDVTTMLAGPIACQLLADFGADVIKIEHPTLGDALRGHGSQKDGKGLLWKTVGRNKRCLALYLGDPRGAEIFLELVRDADVVVESFRPGTLERWGLGIEKLRSVNPKIILTRVSGFGQTGPYAKRAGFGTLVEAMSGFAAMTGAVDGPPVLPPFGLADGIAALAGAFSTMSALYYRDATGGTGQVVDLALLEPIMMILGAQATAYDLVGEIPTRTGNRIKDVAPRNAYECADGRWVAVSSSAQSIAERVMTLVGHPEAIGEPWFATAAGRAENGDLLDAYVADWISIRTRPEVISAFTAAEAAIASVYNIADIVEDEHVKARDVFIRVSDPDFGELVVQNVIARLSETPGRVRFPGRALGQDTDEILGEDLGMSQQAISELRASGIVG